jgi:hypothetical protein
MPGQYPQQQPFPGQPGAIQQQYSPTYNQGMQAAPGMTSSPQNGPMTRPGLSGFGQAPQSGQQGQNSAAQMIQNLLTQPRQMPQGMVGGAGAGLGPGIAGVATKYKGPSIKIYAERQKYQEWEFVFDPKKDAANKAAMQQGSATSNPGNRGSTTSPGFSSGSGSSFGSSGSSSGGFTMGGGSSSSGSGGFTMGGGSSSSGSSDQRSR